MGRRVREEFPRQAPRLIHPRTGFPIPELHNVSTSRAHLHGNRVLVAKKKEQIGRIRIQARVHAINDDQFLNESPNLPNRVNIGIEIKNEGIFWRRRACVFFNKIEEKRSPLKIS